MTNVPNEWGMFKRFSLGANCEHFQQCWENIIVYFFFFLQSVEYSLYEIPLFIVMGAIGKLKLSS